MATTESRQLEWGNNRITFLVLVDEGEGDLEDLQVTDDEALTLMLNPVIEAAPILVERFETNINVTGPGEAIWKEIDKMFDIGDLFTEYAELQRKVRELESNNAALSRQLGTYEAGFNPSQPVAQTVIESQ